MRHTRTLLLVLALCHAPAVSAQSAAPFSQIEISGSGVYTWAAEPLSLYWAPGPGGAVRLTTPFYLGFVSGTITVVPVGTRPGADVPPYLSIMVTGEWAAMLRLPGGVTLTPAFRTGLYGMLFAAPDVSLAVSNEAELVAGVDLRVGVPLGNGWQAGAAVSRLRVMTHHPLDLRLLEIGVSRSMSTPSWLREVLE